jgi:hypothetical protein
MRHICSLLTILAVTQLSSAHTSPPTFDGFTLVSTQEPTVYEWSQNFSGTASYSSQWGYSCYWLPIFDWSKCSTILDESSATPGYTTPFANEFDNTWTSYYGFAAPSGTPVTVTVMFQDASGSYGGTEEWVWNPGAKKEKRRLEWETSTGPSMYLLD